MAISVTGFDSVVSAALDFYIKGDALQQGIQDKPLARDLIAAQESFPSGKENISQPVQGTYMSSTANSFEGFEQDDSVHFIHPDNLLRAYYPWKLVHSGLQFTMHECIQDGINIVDTLDGSKTSAVDGREKTAISNLLKNKLNDFGESWAISFNNMCWRAVPADTKQPPGLLSLLTSTPAVGTTGGLARATYAWWQHRALIGDSKISPSAENQTLIRKLRYELRQLSRYGGKITRLYSGSGMLDALEYEFQAKGQYTIQGFNYKGKNDIGMANISIRGVGEIQYDPTMDDLGLANQLVMIDDRRVKLYVIAGEDKKVHTPARPYDQFVFLRSMTWGGALCCWQLNCNGIYEVNWTPA